MALSLQKDKIRFLLLEGLHDNALKVLEGAGYHNIENISHALDQDELIEKIKDAHFIGIRSRTQLTREVLEHAHKLIGIGCFCIGTNQVDLDAARDAGIPGLTAPSADTRRVAALVLAAGITRYRATPATKAAVHRGGGGRSAPNSHAGRGTRCRIDGYGSI